MDVYYDLHIHSCLSPCAEDDMTPNNIVNMAALKELDFIAITDHNHMGNVATLMKVASAQNIVVVPGMELQTKEDVHLLCFLKNMEMANIFQEFVDTYAVKLPNNTKKFGRQILCNELDEEIGEVGHALILPTDVTLEMAVNKLKELGGAAVPAHIDKKVNSIISNLGFIPDDLGITTVELSGNADDSWPVKYSKFRQLHNSDTHNLWGISEKVNCIELEDRSLEALFKVIGFKE